MRSKGSHFTLGVKGLRVCLLDVAFASATVHVSPLWPCPKRVLQKRTFLEVYFQTLRKVWQAWHFVTFNSNMLHNLSRIVLRDRRNTFAWLAEDELHFSWQTQHYGDLNLHFAWQAQHFRRVVLRVFLQIALSGLRFCRYKCEKLRKSHMKCLF